MKSDIKIQKNQQKYSSSAINHEDRFISSASFHVASQRIVNRLLESSRIID